MILDEFQRVPNLTSYRDRHGVESDLVAEEGRRLTVVEAKSGRSATQDLINAGRQAAEAIGKAANTQRVVVFGGVENQHHPDSTILSWDSIDVHHW